MILGQYTLYLLSFLVSIFFAHAFGFSRFLFCCTCRIGSALDQGVKHYAQLFRLFMHQMVLILNLLHIVVQSQDFVEFGIISYLFDHVFSQTYARTEERIKKLFQSEITDILLFLGFWLRFPLTFLSCFTCKVMSLVLQYLFKNQIFQICNLRELALEQP